MCGNLISSSYIIGNSSAVIEHDIAYQWTFYGYIIGWALTCAYIPIYRSICYKYGCSSLGEIFGKLFSKRVSVCVSVMIFVSLPVRSAHRRSSSPICFSPCWASVARLP